MKKKLFNTGINWEKIYSSKLWKVMRLSGFLFIICVFQVLAGRSYSQSTKLSLNLNQAKISQVLNEIEEQSEFFFLYNHKLIDVDRNVDIDVKDKRIKDILTNLFAGEDVKCLVMDRQIVLSPKDVTKTVSIAKDRQPQEIVVTGKVTDEDGNTLPGVNIIIKGTITGAITDVDGNYSIQVDDVNATLVFSFVGYLTQEIPLEGRSVIDVTMALDILGLEEVVVIGYGTQKKINLTGSVATISNVELVKRPIANVAQMLQGKMAGVSVYSNSGQPGNESTVINIRGFNSFGSDNNPTVLVDGVEGNLNDLDPDNVASISVLKDAASAAIYGSRAANGIILVTTKTGKAGTSSVEYHGNFAIHTPARMPEQVTDIFEYMDMYNIAQTNAGNPGLFSDEMIQKYRTGELKTYNARDQVIKNPFVQKHNLRLTGGNDKTRYSFSAGLWDQPGLVIGSHYKRNNVRVNIDSDINKYISFGANVAGVKSSTKDTYNGYTTQMVSALGYMEENPYPLQFPDGRYVEGIDLDGTHVFQVARHNPLQEADIGGQWNEMFKVNANAYLQIKPFKGFTWRTTAAIKYDHNELKWMFPATQGYRWPDGFTKGVVNVNELIVRQPTQDLFTLFSTVNYTTTINENHTLNFLAGYSQEDFRDQYLMGTRKGMPTVDLMEINAGELDGQSTKGSSYEWAVQSLFGRLNYDFKGKYLAEVNFRYDGSSRFQKDNRWGLFPSFSAGWRISEEDFTQNLDWLSNFKIRGSWGQLGNQIIGRSPGDSQSWNRYEFAEPVGIYPYQPKLILGDGYPYSGTIQADAVQEELENAAITWETTTITNIGIDLNILNGLFSLTFDAYDKNTTDILRIQQIMGQVGLGPPTINSGAMRNTGFDFIASHRQSLGDFSYGIDLTFTRFKNEVTDFGAKEITGISIKEEGLPFDSYYMLEFDGIFQSDEDIANSPTHFYTPAPGDIKLKDHDGDGNVDLEDDRVVIDGRYPDFSYGANAYFNWKDFDLSIFVQGVQGISHVLQGRGVEPFNGGVNVKWRDAWSPTNPSNELSILYAGTADRHGITSTYFLQDASYLRLKNIQLGYTLPRSILGSGFIKGLRVYFSGDNLITITSFEMDPERDKAGARLWASEANYPQIKVFSFGIKANF